MSDVVKNTQHYAEALALTLFQDKNKPNIEGILGALAKEAQRCEDALYSVWFFMLLENAVGDQLDQYGKFLHEARENRGDAEYKVSLKVRIRVLRSKGRTKDIIQIAKLAVGGEVGLSYEDGDVASFKVTKEGLSGFSSRALKKAIRLAKPAAVRAELVYSTSASGVLFRFGSVTTTSVGRGMQSVTDTSYESRLVSGEAV